MKESVYHKQVQEYNFLETYHRELNARIKIRLLTLHHFQKGKTIKDIAELVLLTEKTVLTWIQRFVDFDYEGLIEKEGRGRKPRLSPEDEERFKIELDLLQEKREGGTISAHDIKELLSDSFDCCYGLSGVYALLDRLNIVWITGRSKHPKHDSDAIEKFKNEFPDRVEEITEKINDNKIEIWWQDESRVGQQGTLTRQWASKGTRPRVVKQQQFIYTYIYAAVCPKKDKGCALILPSTSTGMMQIHLDEISERVEKDHHAIIIMDRASWHTTEALNIPYNISIMPLPPYSPELNPVEQLWQQLKKAHLSNRTFKDYSDIVDACVKAWNSYCDSDGKIKKLCSRAWANI